jgi:hypothetical protein
MFAKVNINHENSDTVIRKLDSMKHFIAAGISFLISGGVGNSNAAARCKISLLLDGLKVLFQSPLALNRDLLKHYRVYFL